MVNIIDALLIFSVKLFARVTPKYNIVKTKYLTDQNRYVFVLQKSLLGLKLGKSESYLIVNEFTGEPLCLRNCTDTTICESLEYKAVHSDNRVKATRYNSLDLKYAAIMAQLNLYIANKKQSTDVSKRTLDNIGLANSYVNDLTNCIVKNIDRDSESLRLILYMFDGSLNTSDYESKTCYRLVKHFGNDLIVYNNIKDSLLAYINANDLESKLPAYTLDKSKIKDDLDMYNKALLGMYLCVSFLKYLLGDVIEDKQEQHNECSGTTEARC